MNEIIEILKKVGAVIENDHFVGTSGLHFGTYINKDFLYVHTEETSNICKMMAEQQKDKKIDIVVGPALGGIILSQWVAYHLSKFSGQEVLGVYTEKTPEGGQSFTRGYDKFVKDKKILIVEDLTTTGGSVKKVIEAVKNAGGDLIGISVMVNRNPKLVSGEIFGVPFQSLGQYEIPTYEKKDCPMCKAGIPMNTKVGHGKKFFRK
ncbi:MAG: phosphoribosyltransferase family protein [Candidatus Paceibacterota bacterium]